MSIPEQTPPPVGSIAVILPAAGSGTRFGMQSNKLFALLAGKPLWLHAAERLAARVEVGRIVMAVSASDREVFDQNYAAELSACCVELVLGGAQRSDSVWAALEALQGDESVGWVG